MAVSCLATHLVDSVVMELYVIGLRGGGEVYRMYTCGGNHGECMKKPSSPNDYSLKRWKIIIKENGEQTMKIGDVSGTITNNTPQLNRASIGFWCYCRNHMKVSNLTIQPYTGMCFLNNDYRFHALLRSFFFLFYRLTKEQ